MINKEIKTQLKDQTAGYMAGALGLVAGLAWNDAIKALKKAGIKFKLAGSEIFGDDFALSFSSQVVVLKRKPSKAFRAGIDE